MNSLKYTRFFIYACGIIFFVWLLFVNFAPFGKLIINCKPNYCSQAVLSKISIEGILKNINNSHAWDNTGNSAYFDIKVPRKFTDADILIQTPQIDEARDISVGIMQENNSYYYQSVYYNKELLDILDNNWIKKENSEYIFYQRNDNYFQIEEFINNLPSSDKVAELNANLKRKYNVINNYTSSDKWYIHKENLYGSHEIITYIKDEPLTLNLKFNNSGAGEKSGKVTVSINYWYDTLEQIAKESADVEDEQINIELPQLQEGVYKINIDAPEDVIFTEISTKQKLFVFNGYLKLAPRDHATTIYTNGGFLEGSDGKNLSLGLVGITSYKVSAGSNFFHTAGWFSFQPDNFFELPFNKVSNPINFATINTLQNIDFVLLKKPLPIIEETKEFLELSSSFPREKSYVNGDKIMRVIISSDKPDLYLNGFKIILNK
jgi:hypothetical protein